MTPTEYETLVGELVSEIASSFEDMAGAIAGLGARNKITGASGFKHQIDVSLTVAPWLVLIECKQWRTRVDVEPVLVLASRVADIRATRPEQKIWASLVTQKGLVAMRQHLHVTSGLASIPLEAPENTRCVCGLR